MPGGWKGEGKENAVFSINGQGGGAEIGGSMRDTGLTRKRTSREPVEALLRPVKFPNYIDQQRVSNAFLLSSGESLAGATHFKRNPRRSSRIRAGSERVR